MAIAIPRPYDLDEGQEASLLANFEQDVDEEDEALSLCDLPIEFVKEEKKNNQTHNNHQSEEEFDFGVWARSLSTVEHRISAADELFFKGQILPLRHSVSSEGGGVLLSKAYKDSLSMIGRDISRCESMDSSSISRFTSISSRSSSSSSHHSSGTSTVTTSTTATTNTNTPSFASNPSHRTHDGMIRNRFHDYPSPKPHIKMQSNNLGNVPARTSKSSSFWEFFRIGLVRTPDIELQDLKQRTNGKRCSVSRNNSSTSSSSQTHPSPKKKISQKTDLKQNGVRRMGFFNSSSGSFLGGCKCSVDTVTVPSGIPAVKSGKRESREVDEALQQWKMKKKMEMKQKQVMSRYRTFEWLKELSHGSLPQEI